MLLLACPVAAGAFLIECFVFGHGCVFCLENCMLVASLKLFEVILDFFMFSFLCYLKFFYVVLSSLCFGMLRCPDFAISHFCFLANSALLVRRAVTGVS